MWMGMYQSTTSRDLNHLSSLPALPMSPSHRPDERQFIIIACPGLVPVPHVDDLTLPSAHSRTSPLTPLEPQAMMSGLVRSETKPGSQPQRANKHPGPRVHGMCTGQAKAVQQLKISTLLCRRVHLRRHGWCPNTVGSNRPRDVAGSRDIVAVRMTLQ